MRRRIALRMTAVREEEHRAMEMVARRLSDMANVPRISNEERLELVSRAVGELPEPVNAVQLPRELLRVASEKEVTTLSPKAE